MAENVLQTLQKLVQDVIAPDVRETKVRLESHAKETETRFVGMETRFVGIEKQMVGLEKQIASLSKEVDTQITSLSKEGEAQYKSILAAIAEAKAQTELTNMSEVYALRERVAVLEAQRN